MFYPCRSSGILGARSFARPIFFLNFADIMTLTHHLINIRRHASIPGIIAGLTLIVLTGMLSSCFTGVEGTKTISLSREDRKTIKPSKEENFFRPVEGEPLSKWEKGRPFIAADNRTLIIFDQEGLPLDPEEVGLGGKMLFFEGVSQRIAADGSKKAVLEFSQGDKTYRFNTGKNMSEAEESFRSDMIPMMIDLKMVNSARSLLEGMQLWTKSALWYDDQGERIIGKKYVPVIVDDVMPGNLVFPIKVKFHEPDGKTAWAMLNFGTRESRSFENIFSLSDIRERYPNIEDENWALICAGKVAKGMTKDECKLALGNPKEVDSGRDYTQTLDLWQYPDGTVLWFEAGILTGYRR